jgi:hypothetical protein
MSWTIPDEALPEAAGNDGDLRLELGGRQHGVTLRDRRQRAGDHAREHAKPRLLAKDDFAGGSRYSGDHQGGGRVNRAGVVKAVWRVVL